MSEDDGVSAPPRAVHAGYVPEEIHLNLWELLSCVKESERRSITGSSPRYGLHSESFKLLLRSVCGIRLLVGLFWSS